MNRPTKGIATDGSCLGNPGVGSYRAVDIETGEVLFQSQCFEDCTNNIAEFIAVVHAIGYCQKHGISLPIFSDSQTARAWVRDRRCGSNHVTSNPELQALIDRANGFLQKNSPPKIETWITREYGEVPADFGFKGAR